MEHKQVSVDGAQASQHKQACIDLLQAEDVLQPQVQGLGCGL
jgi:hypothetical protein